MWDSAKRHQAFLRHSRSASDLFWNPGEFPWTFNLAGPWTPEQTSKQEGSWYSRRPLIFLAGVRLFSVGFRRALWESRSGLVLGWLRFKFSGTPVPKSLRSAARRPEVCGPLQRPHQVGGTARGAGRASELRDGSEAREGRFLPGFLGVGVTL